MTTQWRVCGPQSDVLVVPNDAKDWNPDAAALFAYTLARAAHRSQYGAWLLERLRDGYASDLQTYACRSIRGGSSHSEHSHTVAFDVRPWDNPLSDRGFLITDFDRFGAADGEAWLHAIGDPIPGLGPAWQWGGSLYSEDVDVWIACFRRRGSRITTGRVDAMHFEVADMVTPAKVWSIDWHELTAELEDWLMALSQSEQETVLAGAKFLSQHQNDFGRLFAFLDGIDTGMTKAASAGSLEDTQQAGFRLVRKLSLRDQPVKPI